MTTAANRNLFACLSSSPKQRKAIKGKERKSIYIALFYQASQSQGWQVSAITLGLNRFKPSWQKQVSTRVSATLTETGFCRSF